MRVLQINSVCGIGSTGRIATDIHDLLIKQGHESYIAYGRDLSKSCDTSIRIGSKIDNYMHVALTRVFDKTGFGSKRATREFIEKVENLEPDIIHLHNIHGYYINIELLFDYLKKTNIPVVWTLHDCWSFTGHCAYFDYANCDKWLTACYDCPQKSSYPTSRLFDNSTKNYQIKKDTFTDVENLTIVTPSKWLARLVEKSYLQEYPIKVINNGIDLNVFKPTPGYFRENNRLENKFVILGVASMWDRRKGFKYFIELSKMINDDEMIVLVGVSEKQKAKLPQNIIGITRTNNTHELAEIYSAADVFVNPTLEDVMPTTNIEALACGIPVITFSTGGSVESVDNQTWAVVGKGDLDGLKNEIINIKNGNKKYQKNNVIQRAKSNYDKQERCVDYINQYKVMIGARR